MNRSIQSEIIRTIDLDHDQLLVLEDHTGTRVRVLFGGVWLTEQGRPDDCFAQAGDELLLAQRGRAILGGIGRSRIELIEPVKRGIRRLGEALAVLRSRGPLMLVRGLMGVVSLVLALGLPEMLARGFQQGATAPTLPHGAAAPVRA